MSSKQIPLLVTSIENGIQTIAFNRPTKKNAFNGQMYAEWIKIMQESENNESVFMLVITGNGDFYSSGHDFLHGIESGESAESQMDLVKKTIEMLILYPKLLVAIVNGPAIGLAATTLGLFDIVYASETAYFLTPFSKLGLTPEGCSSYTFPKIMGPSKAGEMLLFGEKLSVQEAAQFGYVSRVYKADKVNEIWAHLHKMSSLSKESLLATKRLLSRWNKEILLKVNKEELQELKQVYESPTFGDNMVTFMIKKSKL